jgi:hypothetical protein
MSRLLLRQLLWYTIPTLQIYDRLTSVERYAKGTPEVLSEVSRFPAKEVDDIIWYDVPDKLAAKLADFPTMPQIYQPFLAEGIDGLAILADYIEEHQLEIVEVIDRLRIAIDCFRQEIDTAEVDHTDDLKISLYSQVWDIRYPHRVYRVISNGHGWRLTTLDNQQIKLLNVCKLKLHYPAIFV